ncbi:hypothetical protein CE195_11605 [Sodalis-like symbiont of Philaenus spumarius]|nr:hypothetical protein CE195_11605 [Sodalis-like symbiont of Philaenus spumarius]
MLRLMLSDDQYERMSPFLPGKASDPGRTAVDNRLFVEAVLTSRNFKVILVKKRPKNTNQITNN